jgi:hypothetical protein
MNFSITTIDKGISADIEKKGIKLNQEGLTEWLKTKNLFADNETLICFNDIQPWQRTGGETYSTIFNFKTDKQEQTIVVKAIVTTSPEKSLIDWTKRRTILAENNISVSHWFWTGEATIYEPFYPNKVDKTKDFNLLIETAFTLDKLGFATLKFLDDILCDKDGNPFYIDFGFDLGEPSHTVKTTAKEHLIKTYPNLKGDIEAFYSTNS